MDMLTPRGPEIQGSCASCSLSLACMPRTQQQIRCAGGVSKGDLKRFLHWGAGHLGYPELANVVAAPPTAELEPIREGSAAQTDEQDMGMTYEVGP